jgi:hypothetical protein
VRIETLEADKKERKRTNFLLLLAIFTPLVGIVYDHFTTKGTGRNVYESHYENQNYNTGRYPSGGIGGGNDSTRFRVTD